MYIYIYCVYKYPHKMRWQISEERPPSSQVFPDQGLPGRARARSRCCAPSCATRSAPWAPPVPQRARQKTNVVSRESWCMCVCHEIAIHVHISIYAHLYAYVCIYIYIMYINPSVSPLYLRDLPCFQPGPKTPLAQPHWVPATHRPHMTRSQGTSDWILGAIKNIPKKGWYMWFIYA